MNFSRTEPLASPRPTPRVDRHFLRHYGEMVLAMMAGMVVLAPPVEAALRLAGSSSADLQATAPALALMGMAAMMSAPMVGWMRHRGHGWRACSEMTISMLLPTAAAIGLLASAVLTDLGTLMLIEHVAMLPSMLVAMLLRPDEY